MSLWNTPRPAGGWLVSAEEYLMENLKQWAQDTFLDGETGKFKFNKKEIEDYGRQLGMAEEEIKIVLEDLERLNASVVQAGAPGDGPNDPPAGDATQRLEGLLTNVPDQARTEFTQAAEHAVRIRDVLLELVNGDASSPADQDKYSRMLSTIGFAYQNTMQSGRPDPVLNAIEELKEIRKESSVDAIAGMINRTQRQEVSAVENSMIREVFEQGLRQSSVDGRELQWIWPLVKGVNTNPVDVQANTGFSDPQATIRAAFLMGQCTCELWRKAVAEVKKACGEDIKRQVHGLTRWGTIQPSEAAVRDIVLKTLQAKEIYPYPDFVQELMHALGYNPWQDRGLGPETDRSPQRESSVQTHVTAGEKVTVPTSKGWPST